MGIPNLCKGFKTGHLVCLFSEHNIGWTYGARSAVRNYPRVLEVHSNGFEFRPLNLLLLKMQVECNTLHLL